ncbi:class I adenylate-forming enzyme family protein [Kitasatospora sp. NPDC057223]|uniref:class I adenylate-forming enzyme family protein n=1 Tax=Kitasatospora sp. NPDC057223 TaxID=3346055 RepID=UPI00362B115E
MTSDSLALVTRVQAALRAPGMPFAVTGTPAGPHYDDGPRTLRELLDATRAHGDRPFLLADGTVLTFAEHYARAAALAHRLLDGYGLRAGDRVVIAMSNLPEWQIAFWAAQAAGLVAVPLNAWWEAQELAYALDDCAPAVVIADRERADRIEPWLARRPAADRPRLLTVGAPPRPWAERFEDLPAPAPGTTSPDAPIDPGADATLLYTSGTTGRPKAVAATHAAWCAAAVTPRFFAATAVLCAGGELAGVRPQTVLMTFPFFHVAAFTTMLPVMTGGGTAVLLRKWDPAEALRLIDLHRVTTFTGVPTTALGLLDAADLGGARLPSLAMISTGGAAAPPGLAPRITARFDGRVDVRNGYGLTETCGGVLANLGDRYREHPDSVGRPCPAVEVRIADPADPAGAALPDGEVGELWLRGQQVFRGYRGDAAATGAAFRDGWFRTGDLARLRDGEVYIVDRLKDMVIRGGENVYCVEVEGVLCGHPAVEDAAVLGVPHPALGEEVAAVVVLRPGATAAEDALREHVAGRLAAFKVPAHLVFHPGPLPRNPTGKLVKQVLREAVTAKLPR